MFKILGTDDSVNACDCCGKSNLKSTVVVDVDGEILHYGSICATGHTGMTASGVKRAVAAAYAAKLDAAMREFKRSAEYIAQEVAFAAAHRAGLIGVSFRDATRVESLAAAAKSIELEKKHGIRSLVC